MLNVELVERSIRESVVPRTADQLTSARWFGDKGKTITSIAAIDSTIMPLAEGWLALTVVGCSFADQSADAWYFVPYAIVDEATPSARPLTTVTNEGSNHAVVDAFTLHSFAEWLIEQHAEERAIPSARGWFAWTRFAGASGCLTRAREDPPRLSTVEQSNTGIAYGESVFLKVFRRLRSGIQPDEELGRFLAEQTDFRHFPAPLAAMSYVGEGGRSYSVSLAQRFVPNRGDGWSVTLESLAALAGSKLDPGHADELLAARSAAMSRLGQRTGELHLALASSTNDPAFVSARMSASEILEWEERVRRSLLAADAILRQRRGGLAPATKDLIDRFHDRVPDLMEQIEAVRLLKGSANIRVHGDYHLGQVIETADDDWAILDFEGEPARSIEQRRAKTTVLKDLAGMTRSFSYARGAALRAIADGDLPPTTVQRLGAWEMAARHAFLTAYKATVRAAPVRLVPDAPDEFDATLRALELEKALYEIDYEVNNRPTWLDLPIQSLLQ